MAELVFDDSDGCGVFLKEFPDYLIHENGKVFSMLTRKFLKSQKVGGYIYFYLNRVRDGVRKRVTIGQHFLVATAFIPNPKGLPIPHHKDDNGCNNSIDNLEWVTDSDNTQDAYNKGIISHGRPVLQYTKEGEFVRKFKSASEAARSVGCSVSHITQVCRGRKGKKTAKGHIWKFETEKESFKKKEGEKWVKIPEIKGYKISNKGRLYSTKTNRFMSQTERKDGYRRVGINKKKYYVHWLMARSFFGPPPIDMINPVANHKDGNKENNVIENLEWTSKKDDVIHAHETGLNSTCKQVVRYTLKGVPIATYRSVADAARDVGVSHTSILMACNKEKHVHTIVDCLWRFTSDPLNVAELENIKRSKRSVVKYSVEGEPLEMYSSIQKASKDSGAHPSSISNACRGKIKTAGGFMWSYEGDSPPERRGKFFNDPRKIEQLTKEGELIRIWDSISEAGRALKISSSHITSVFKGKRQTTGGFRWRYV